MIDQVMAWFVLVLAYTFLAGPMIVAGLCEGPPPGYWECFWKWHGTTLIIAAFVGFCVALFWAIGVVAG